MGAGVNEIRALPGKFSIDLLQLRSPAPVTPAPQTGGGTVTSAGTVGQNTVNGVRVSLSGPSWLVLGQSFDLGWSAQCDGRSLGDPVPIDGYANGWLAPAGCRNVRFFFAPQSGVQLSYVVSAVVAVALVALLAFGGWRLRRRRTAIAPARLLPDAGRGAQPPVRAALLALISAAVIGWIFASRVGVISFPVLTFLFWRGIGPAALTWIAAGLLGIVVPVIYEVATPPNLGGYNFAYATKLIGAHWIGVASIVLLALACGKMIAAARAGRHPPPPASPLDEGDQHPVGAVEQEVVRS
jgi:hypothetical protein